MVSNVESLLPVELVILWMVQIQMLKGVNLSTTNLKLGFVAISRKNKISQFLHSESDVLTTQTFNLPSVWSNNCPNGQGPSSTQYNLSITLVQ